MRAVIFWDHYFFLKERVDTALWLELEVRGKAWIGSCSIQNTLDCVGYLMYGCKVQVLVPPSMTWWKKKCHLQEIPQTATMCYLASDNPPRKYTQTLLMAFEDYQRAAAVSRTRGLRWGPAGQHASVTHHSVLASYCSIYRKSDVCKPQGWRGKAANLDSRTKWSFRLSQGLGEVITCG